MSRMCDRGCSVSMLVIAGVLAVVGPTTTGIRAVTFEDAAIGAGYSYDSTGTIDVRSMNVDSLAGVNLFTAADWIDVSRNFISSIDTNQFSGLGSLQSLDLSRNEIGSIESADFSGLPGLRSLNLGRNQINTIEPGALLELTNLIWLDLPLNQITSIRSLGGKAYEVNLQRNLISTIEADAFSRLDRPGIVFLQDNQISSIESGAFTGMSSLEAIFLERNQLTHLNLSRMDVPALECLSLNGNAITSVDLSDAVLSWITFCTLMEVEFPSHDIRTIDLCGADLSDVRDLSCMFALDDLVTLDLSHALLPDVNEVDDLVVELEPFALDEMTLSWDQWWLMEPATRTILTDWDAGPANTLTIVPEPAAWVLLVCGLSGLLLACCRRWILG